jgi:hypothetical protein
MKNSIQISIKSLLIIFVLTGGIFSNGWENSNSIEISGTALYKDNHQVVSDGFVRIIVFNQNANEINLIKIVPINTEGEFSSGKIYLKNEDIIKIGAYANDVSMDSWGFTIINNGNQQSDAIEIGAYANDINWDQFDNLIIKNNNQQSDAIEIGAYANDINWDQFDNLIICTNNQQTDGIEIGAYANNMTEINLESNLDNVIIYAERNSNNLDNGGLEFIGTYPRRPVLNQNFPNPFNPVTNITYSIATNTRVSIKVYDITGKEITTLVNEYKTPGHYSISFNGSNLSSGFYFYRVSAGDYTEMKKMSLLK